MAIAYPPNECFAYVPRPLDQAVGGRFNSYLVALQKDPSGGMLAYSSDHLFPRKGLAYPEAALHNNIMKNLFMTTLSCLMSLRPTVRWLENALLRINQLGDRVYLSQVPSGENQCPTCARSTMQSRPDFLRFGYYTPACSELWNLGFYFLRHLGISPETSWRTGRLAATLFEYEEPYRLRLQDMFTLFDRNAFITAPHKELRRVLAAYQQRESQNHAEWGINTRVSRALKLVSLLLYIPRFRNALMFAIQTCDLQRLRLDTADTYHALLEPSYNYFGLDLETRKQKFIELCKTFGVTATFQDS